MTAQVAIDTNVLVCLLVRDDPSQQAMAQTVLSRFACQPQALPFLSFDAKVSRLEGARLID